jgi:hypothetical protein
MPITDAEINAIIDGLLKPEEKKRSADEKAGIAVRRLAADHPDRYLDLAQLLDSTPRLVNSVSSTNGRTALHCAAEKGNIKAFDLLMDRKADPCALDREKNTPIALLLRNIGAKIDSQFPAISSHARRRKLETPEGATYQYQVNFRRFYVYGLLRIIDVYMEYKQAPIPLSTIKQESAADAQHVEAVKQNYNFYRFLALIYAYCSLEVPSHLSSCEIRSAHVMHELMRYQAVSDDRLSAAIVNIWQGANNHALVLLNIRPIKIKSSQSYTTEDVYACVGPHTILYSPLDKEGNGGNSTYLEKPQDILTYFSTVPPGSHIGMCFNFHSHPIDFKYAKVRDEYPTWRRSYKQEFMRDDAPQALIQLLEQTLEQKHMQAPMEIFEAIKKYIQYVASEIETTPGLTDASMSLQRLLQTAEYKKSLHKQLGIIFAVAQVRLIRSNLISRELADRPSQLIVGYSSLYETSQAKTTAVTTATPVPAAMTTTSTSNITAGRALPPTPLAKLTPR